MVRVAAGEVWDDVVARAVSEGWSGIEALSGIPGCAGATPIQNVGAYGQEVAQTIASGARLGPATSSGCARSSTPDCAFTYRHSVFKARPAVRRARRAVPAPGRRALRAGGATPTSPARSGSSVGRRACRWPTPARPCWSSAAPRGMVLDADDHDTWSCGSFFTNPILSRRAVRGPARPGRERLGADGRRPRRASPTPDGRVKTSAAWLIDQAGFGKGYGLPGPAALSTKHTLALTNRGGATAADVAGPGPRDPRRGAGRLRRHPGQRAGPRRRLALSAPGRPVDGADRRGGQALGRCRQPGVDVVEQGLAQRLRGPRLASHGPAGQARRARSSAKPRAVAGRSRTARPAASRTAAGRRRRAPPVCRPRAIRRSGTSAAVGVDPEGDVAAGADLERDAALGHHRPAPGGPRRCARRGRGGRAAGRSRVSSTAAGPSSSPPWGTQGQPGAAGDVEGAGEVAR